jgi:hypothetical protein
MLKQDNTALRLLPEKSKEEKTSDEKLRSIQALKVVKKEKKGPAVLMPPQEQGYIKPPRYDFF